MPTNVLTAKSAWVLFSLAVGPAHNVGPPGVQTTTSDFTAYVAYSWPSREECEVTIVESAFQKVRELLELMP